MARYARLSSPINELKPHYTVVVVGSGYGGGIAASRLARAGQSVCVLERGKERQPGEFPETSLELIPEIQLETTDRRVNHRNGLYDVRIFDQIGVLLGCGLGGTSLINANVAVEPDPRVFDDLRWPSGLRDDRAGLAAGYQRARDMLKPRQVPACVNPSKLRVLEESAGAMDALFRRAEVNVTFSDRPGEPDDPEGTLNQVGVRQPSCIQCGDCMTGCNRGAKNTTLMTYLPDAVNHGAEIYTEVEVRRIARNADNTYAVHYRVLDAQRELFNAPDQQVTADVVVLAAGTLGSTEILLRSRDAGLSASPRIGAGFSGNGGVVGFGYDGAKRVNGVGRGHEAAEHAVAHAPDDIVGSCITAMIDLRREGAALTDVNQGMIIEEGSLPSPLANLVPFPLAVAAGVLGDNPDPGIGGFMHDVARDVASLVNGPYRGPLQNTQTYLVTSHEQGSGSMELVRDRVRIVWPGVGEQPIFQQINQRLEQATRAHGGTFVRDPLWTEELANRLFTTHPLGGCAMADSAAAGVVNHKGQVFSGAAGDAVHDGLYVSDGSVMSRSLGCNPLLTISALAERTCALIARDRGWAIDYAPRPTPPPDRRPDTVGVEFSERMTGYFSAIADDARGRAVTRDDCLRAEDRGRASGSTLEMILTVVAEDVARLTSPSDPDYEAGMTGTVTAAALSSQPLSVTRGRFSLLVHDPEQADGKLMRYRMRLSSVEGKRYWFEGTKYIRDDPGPDLWSDTTTLYIKVSEGEAPGGAVLGCGVVRVGAGDFLKQLRSTRAVNGRTVPERLAAVARLGTFIAGSLWGVYGGIFAGHSTFQPDAPLRKKRVLHLPPPEVHDFPTRDLTILRLTRYPGKRGPVMLVHGLGVSSSIFTLDTIDTNLVEYLSHHGYDVWLLDLRSSIDRSSHRGSYTGDEVAQFDYPAAIKQIRELTGAATVQVVAHCFGATTLLMAMLAGLEGVRSAVISQGAVHVYTPTASRIRAGLHIPEVLEAFGITSLGEYAAAHLGWKDRLFDSVLRLYPTEYEERCSNPLCRRIALLYGSLYEHDQLNAATHGAIHELFGDAAIPVFEHLARMSRVHRVVRADGGDIYLADDNLRRLAIPIAFLHGAENACILPRSTAETVAALGAVNGAEHYQHHVIPGYGHIDCIIGHNAVRDVYPAILAQLDATA